MEKVAIELKDSDAVAQKPTSGILEKISFFLLVSIPFVIPLFFVSVNVVPVQFSKTILLSAIVLLSLVFWILSRLKDGKFSLPVNRIFLAGVLVIAVSVLSAFFSTSLRTSLVGQLFELNTVATFIILFLITFLVPIYFRSKDNIFYAYLTFFASFFILALYEVVRLIFGAGFLSFGMFNDLVSTMLGKWNDVGIFFGVGTVLTLVTLELISLNRFFKMLLYGVLAISLFFLAIVNLNLIWYVLAVFSLGFLVYIVSFDKSDALRATAHDSTTTVVPVSRFKKVPRVSLVVLVISIIFILGGNFLSSKISGVLNLNQFEVRPSWGATYAVAKGTFAKNPLLGSGPNTFVKDWLTYKPDDINLTVFWNTDFNYGIGLVPTMMISTGILGSVAWIVFFMALLYWGFKSTFASTTDKVSRYLISSSFLVTLFLWIMNVLYVPSLPTVALTFFFTGLFLASLYQADMMKFKSISFVEDPKIGFASVLLLILILVSMVTFGYAVLQKSIATFNYQRGVVTANSGGDLDKAQSYLEKAESLDAGTSQYYRFLAQIDLSRMNSLLSQDVSKMPAEEVKNKFKTYLTNALNNSQEAVKADKNDYLSWSVLGQVYQTVVPLKISGAYENAVSAYGKAIELYPKNPAFFLLLARLEIAHEDSAKAKNHIASALKLKNNYTEAIFLLAQMQVSEGNLKDAIDSVQAASYLSPSDSGLLFQLGFLRFNVKDYKGAAEALAQAITLNTNYANAKYFLGLSLYHLNQVPGAIAQFQDLKATNPDNKEVDLILKNLIAGKDPFANAVPPIDSKPEKRSTLPVKEKTSAKTKSTTSDEVTSDTTTN